MSQGGLLLQEGKWRNSGSEGREEVGGDWEGQEEGITVVKM